MTVIGGRYQLVEKLGQGGMGEVYRGVDTRTETPVAIKNLHSSSSIDPDVLERFRREGAALRELNHPNIVKMLDMIQHEGTYYLVMEYIDGGDLSDLLRVRGKLPMKEAIKMALELTDALSRAHHLGIIHRDIKPANVLIARDGTPRLTDFGVAHIEAEERLTGTGVAVGTLDYMPPEALNGESVDARGDIWALGVMLYEMITGERLFSGDTTMSLLTNILTKPVPDIKMHTPDAPSALQDLIEQMLQKNRDLRIRSARQVGAALEAILRGETVNLQWLDTPPTPRVSQVVVESETSTDPRMMPVPASSPRLPMWLIPVVTLFFVFIGAVLVASGAFSNAPDPTPTPTETTMPTALPASTSIAINASAPEGYQWVSVDQARLLVPTDWEYLDVEAFINVIRETFGSEDSGVDFDQGQTFIEELSGIGVYFNWLAFQGVAVLIEDTGVVLSPELQVSRIRNIIALSDLGVGGEPETLTLPVGTVHRIKMEANINDLLLQMSMYSYQHGTTQYMLITAGRSSQIEAMQPTIETILNSFYIAETEDGTPLPEVTAEVTPEIAVSTGLPTPNAIVMDAFAPEGYQWIGVDETRLLVPTGWAYFALLTLMNTVTSSPPNEGEILEQAMTDAGLAFWTQQRTSAIYFNWLGIQGVGIFIEDTGLILNDETLDGRISNMLGLPGDFVVIEESETLQLPAGAARRYVIEGEVNNLTMQITLYGLRQGATQYMLLFLARSDRLEALQPIIETVTNSFQIVEVEAGTPLPEATAEITPEGSPEPVESAGIPDGWKTVQGEGFSVSIPPNWLNLPPNEQLMETSMTLFVEPEGRDAYLEQVQPLIDSFTPHLLLGKLGGDTPVAGGVVTMDSPLELSFEFLEAYFFTAYTELGVEFYPIEVISLPGGTAHRLHLTRAGSDGMQPVDGIIYIIDTPGGFYCLTFITTMAGYDEQLPTFDQIAQTFMVERSDQIDAMQPTVETEESTPLPEATAEFTQEVTPEPVESASIPDGWKAVQGDRFNFAIPSNWLTLTPSEEMVESAFSLSSKAADMEGILALLEQFETHALFGHLGGDTQVAGGVFTLKSSMLLNFDFAEVFLTTALTDLGNEIRTYDELSLPGGAARRLYSSQPSSIEGGAGEAVIYIIDTPAGFYFLLFTTTPIGYAQQSSIFDQVAGTFMAGRSDQIDAMQPTVETEESTPLPEVTAEVTTEITPEGTPELAAPMTIPDDWKTVQGDGFSLALPPNWLAIRGSTALVQSTTALMIDGEIAQRIIELSQEFSVQMLMGGQSNNSVEGPVVGAILVENSTQVSLDFLDDYMQAIGIEIGAEVSDAENIILSSGSARRFLYTLPSSDDKSALKVLISIIETSQGFYMLSFATNTSQYEGNLSIFEQIAETFRVTPSDG